MYMLNNCCLVYSYNGFVFVSSVNLSSILSFHNFLSNYILVDYGSWFDHTLDWEKVIEDHPAYPIHTVYYENMKEVSVYTSNVQCFI
jgi:hypothetical protein